MDLWSATAHGSGSTGFWCGSATTSVRREGRRGTAQLPSSWVDQAPVAAWSLGCVRLSCPRISPQLVRERAGLWPRLDRRGASGVIVAGLSARDAAGLRGVEAWALF